VNYINDSFFYTKWTRVALPVVIGNVGFQSRGDDGKFTFAADELFRRRYPDGMTTIH
jgi:hypothetical protein